MPLYNSLVLFNFVNVVNSVKYIYISIVLTAGAISIYRTFKKTSLGWYLVLLFVVYLVHPTHLGRICDADNRIGFYLTMFLVTFGWERILTGFSGYKLFLIQIPVILFIAELVVSLLQFGAGEPRLNQIVNALRKSPLRHTAVVHINQPDRLTPLADSSRVFKLLRRLKLHTDLTQLTRAEEHMDSYFYLNGGFPTRLSTMSIIRRIPGYSPLSTAKTDTTFHARTWF